MDQVWLDAPAPAMKVWRESDAPRWRANRVLADAGAADGLREPAQWQALAEALLALCEGAGAPVLSIGGAAHRATVVPLPPGWLVWLEAAPLAQRPPNAHISPHSAFNAALPQWISLSGVSVWRLDLATERIQLNDVGYEAVGVEPRPDGVDIGQFRAAIHPDDLEDVAQAAREAAASDRIVDLVTRYRTRDGGYRHWITRRVAQRDAQGRVVALAGVSIDQTERFVERQRAQALAQRISFITEAAGVGVWSADLHGDTFEWNEQMFRIYGIAPEAGPPSLVRFFNEIVHPQDREALRARSRLDPGAASGPVQLEFRIRRPDGSERWLSSWLRREWIDDRPVDNGVTIDVTELRMAAAQLREANERALLAAESAGIGTWERDLTSQVSVWNAQMYRLRGLEPVGGATPEALRIGSRHPDDGTSFDARMQRAVDEGTPFEEEMRVVWPDGSIHWIASRAIPQPGPSGRMERLLGVNWDITERKRAEQALREKAAAEQASRAKSEFLSRMSHELRTPLNAVIGFAQLLSQDAAEPLTARQAERVDRVHSAGLHLLALIDDVLDLATIESASLSLASEAVSLKAAVDDALQWTQPQAERAGVTLHAGPLDGWVQADGRRLRQILSNLLSNAVKYNRPGGEVRLRLAACAVQGRRGWQVCVRDTGRGMTPQQRAHLFEPFNRLGAEREGIEGTGIGLAIVRHLLGVMGGSIEVESTPGEGSEFRFTLPLAQAPAASAPGTADDVRPSAAPATEGLRLLYIEDNAVNVLLVQELVAMRGNVQLLVAPNGETGVAMALAEQPDVVLIDMQLPDFDGFEVLRRLQAHGGSRAGRACIALSANAMPEDVDRARAAGFDDYWTKPIDFAQFLAKLDALALAG